MAILFPAEQGGREGVRRGKGETEKTERTHEDPLKVNEAVEPGALVEVKVLP
jgi:hypothetical protein